MPVFIGVDWGGTKIEIVALDEGGNELLRVRRPTPRGDYHGCLATVRALVEEAEAQLGNAAPVGIGIPGSLDPETGLGKGGSSTWINGQPVAEDLHRVLD